MHNKIYYIHNGSEQKGPFSVEDLKQLSITKDTNIWYDGASDWKKASEIPELKDLLVVIPPKFMPPIEKKGNPPPIKSSTSNSQKNRSLLFIIIAIIGIGGTFAIYTISKKGAEVSIENALREQELQKQIEEQEKLERDKLAVRTNLNQYISIKRSDYSVDRLWGGITDLYFEVTNKSNYNFDAVILEVRYIRGNGGLFKTERVTINNIAPLETVSKQAPDSNKGQKADYDIMSIYSSDLNLCYEKDKLNNRNSNDPYKCN